MNEFDEQTDFSFLAITEQKCPVVAKKAQSVKVIPGKITVSLTRDISEAQRRIISEYRKSAKTSDAQKLMISKRHKGKTISDDHKLKVTLANEKTIMTPLGFFASQQDAAKFFGITYQAMHYRMKLHPSLYYYLED